MKLLRLFFVIALLALPAGQTAAQSLGQVVSPVLTIDREALFTRTEFGQRVSQDLETESDALSEETRKIEQALEEEERSLTAKRATMSPEEFRALADAFDEKVVALRTDRDAAQQNFVQRYEDAQRSFYNRIGPILGRVMQDRNAVVILDKRNVLLSVNAIDVTDAVIARIDAELGDGTEGPAGSADGSGSDTTDSGQ